jgi:amphi-Trp domain-containing protein
MTREINYSGELPVLDAAHKLGELSLGFMQGRVELKSADAYLACHPGSTVHFRIDAKESEDRGKLIIELSWPLRLEVESGSGPAQSA